MNEEVKYAIRSATLVSDIKHLIENTKYDIRKLKVDICVWLTICLLLDVMWWVWGVVKPEWIHYGTVGLMASLLVIMFFRHNQLIKNLKFYEESLEKVQFHASMCLGDEKEFC